MKLSGLFFFLSVLVFSFSVKQIVALVSPLGVVECSHESNTAFQQKLISHNFIGQNALPDFTCDLEEDETSILFKKPIHQMLLPSLLNAFFLFLPFFIFEQRGLKSRLFLSFNNVVQLKALRL